MNTSGIYVVLITCLSISQSPQAPFPSPYTNMTILYPTSVPELDFIYQEITSCSKLPSCISNYSQHLCFYNCCWQHTIVCRRPRHNKLTLNVPLTYYYLLCKIVLLHQQLFMTPTFLKLLLTTYYCMQKTQTPYWPDLNVPLEYYYNTKFLLNLRSVNSFAPSWNLGICWSWAHTQWQHTC